MRKLLLALLLLLLYAVETTAQNGKVQGYAGRGGQTVTVGGVVSSSATPIQRSYPSCTVTVFDSGTVNLATIFSNATGTTKANPFTAASDGLWFFYGPAGNHYDVQFSGSFSTFTISDLISPLSGGMGTGTVSSVAVSVPPFLSVSGSPITTAGTLAISLSGTALPVANGGTGSTSQNFVDLTTNQSPIAGNKLFSGITTLGTGTINGSGMPAGTSTPSVAAFTRGTLVSGSTSTSPVITFSSISNAAYTGGSGQFLFYGLRTNNAPMEVLSILGLQSSAITGGGGLVPFYVRMANSILGDASSSHFAAAFSSQKFATLDSDTVAEFDIENISGANATFSYGDASNRSNGVLIVGKDTGSSKKNTVALVIDADSAASSFWTGIDIRPTAIDRIDVTHGFRAIVIPNGTSIYSRNFAGTDVVNIIGVDGLNVLQWAAGGNTSNFGGIVTSASYIDPVSGFKVNGAAVSGNVLRGNGTTFVPAVLAAADLSNGVTGTGALVLANTPTLITPNIGAATGASLSLTTNQNGITSLSVTNTNGGTNAVAAVLLTNNVGANAGFFGLAGGGYTALPILQGKLFFDANSTTTGIILNTESTIPIVFGINTAEAGRWTGGSSLSIGATPPTVALAGSIHYTGVAFASLATPDNGTVIYCTDCTLANPCAGGGTGAIAKRLNGVWVCN